MLRTCSKPFRRRYVSNRHAVAYLDRFSESSVIISTQAFCQSYDFLCHSMQTTIFVPRSFVTRFYIVLCPGRTKAISRWLSEATPPDQVCSWDFHPGRMTDFFLDVSHFVQTLWSIVNFLESLQDSRQFPSSYPVVSLRSTDRLIAAVPPGQRKPPCQTFRRKSLPALSVTAWPLRPGSALRLTEGKAIAFPKTPQQWHKFAFQNLASIDSFCHRLFLFFPFGNPFLGIVVECRFTA